ncbi:hypothetical protein BGAL_0103g00280 [Botrytis galanthina]|uniref:Uncharacterized protein n=1 Tax=Botrytis galanthina TaxID=278940 RepID=A0A4S8RBD1_9HELO|nr:hypothetical protein BGAL_0103g00280 [Botrytis galanthina]
MVLRRARRSHQSAPSLETYNAFRAQEPDHRPATQLQVGQSQASAIQSYGTQQVGGFTDGYSHSHTNEQQPVHPAIYPVYRTQYQENLGSSSVSQSWAMQPSTGQTSATQSYIGQPPGGNTGAHSHDYQSGQGSQGGQDYQHYHYQGSGR